MRIRVRAGAALGPLLTGIISPTGWQNVFYMLIVADVAALAISSYIYFTYDRAAPTATPLDAADCRCRVTVKPPCCRLTLFHWLVVAFTVLLLSLVVVLLPEAYHRRSAR